MVSVEVRLAQVLAIRGEADLIQMLGPLHDSAGPPRSTGARVLCLAAQHRFRASSARRRGAGSACGHIPNGWSNGWIKIDQPCAPRYGLEESQLPQIVAGDFNAPQAQRYGEVITFGQNRDGSFSPRTDAKLPYSPERPWESRLWDAGERAVLEGLPRELDIPGFTRGPRGRSQTVGSITSSSRGGSGFAAARISHSGESASSAIKVRFTSASIRTGAAREVH